MTFDQKEPAYGRVQIPIAGNPQSKTLAPIEQYWESIDVLTDQQQIFLAAIITSSLATGSTINETLDLLDPDCSYVSEPFDELLEAIATEPPAQQLVLIQAITAAVGLSMFTADIEG